MVFLLFSAGFGRLQDFFFFFFNELKRLEIYLKLKEPRTGPFPNLVRIEESASLIG